MSDPSPDDEPELIVSLPEGSLDDLFAGLEASLKDTRLAKAAQAPEPYRNHPATRGRSRSLPRPSRESSGAARRRASRVQVRAAAGRRGLSDAVGQSIVYGIIGRNKSRLCPGRTVDVFLLCGGIRRVLRATVIRSTMHAVAPNPVFRRRFNSKTCLRCRTLNYESDAVALCGA